MALVGARRRDVCDLRRLAGLRRATHRAFALAQWRCPQRLHQDGVQVMRGPDVKRLRRVVILVDGAAVRTRKLARPGDDGLEHGLDIERRAHRLADLAERRELVHRADELTRPRLQLLKQADVLDGDHRLVSEGLEEFDLVLRERPGRGDGHRDDADGSAFRQHGYPDAASKPHRGGEGCTLNLRIHLHAAYVDRRALEDNPAYSQGAGWTHRKYSVQLRE